MSIPSNINSIGPFNNEPILSRDVYFTGDVALKRGMAMVIDLVPTAAQAGIGQCVKLPTSTFKDYFVGVAMEDKPARIGGQFVKIALPGSVVPCLVGPATTAGETVVVYSQTDGKFGAATAEKGVGTAVALETRGKTVSDGGLVKCWLVDSTACEAPAFATA